MSEMIDRVAREIADAIADMDYDAAARAAIEAMREPTMDMIDAGTAADWVGEAESRAGMSIMPTERPDWLDDDEPDHVKDRRGIWPAMIDTALKTKPPGD